MTSVLKNHRTVGCTIVYKNDRVFQNPDVLFASIARGNASVVQAWAESREQTARLLLGKQTLCATPSRLRAGVWFFWE